MMESNVCNVAEMPLATVLKKQRCMARACVAGERGSDLELCIRIRIGLTAFAINADSLLDPDLRTDQGAANAKTVARPWEIGAIQPGWMGGGPECVSTAELVHWIRQSLVAHLGTACTPAPFLEKSACDND